MATGRIGLALQRTELTADLSQQVLDPRQVRLGGGQPALGALLATAVLQDTRRLLDDQAALLGAGVEDAVDVALGDDDVLLTADAGVAQQLLDVEQAARHAVDRVLAVTRPEEQTGDRHLGEVDRQVAGGVVDRQGDLGTAERGALRGAGEDDVVHLLGPHDRRLLGAEHPADRVDDVGLARAVRPDDHRHTRLQGQRRRIGERLEPLDLQCLQEHVSPAGVRVLVDWGPMRPTGPTGPVRPVSARRSRCSRCRSEPSRWDPVPGGSSRRLACTR